MNGTSGNRFPGVAVAKSRAVAAIGFALAFGAASARSAEPAVGSQAQGIALESAPAVFEATAQIMARHDWVLVEAPQKTLDFFIGRQGPCGTPPDTMGAVGPTQFISFVNCNVVSYDKSTGLQDGVLDTTPNNFFNSVRSSGTSDPHVRYDRTSQRWFLSSIDVTFPNNRLLLAISDTSTITPSTTWGFFFVQTAVGTHTNCLADYPTPGVDANAIYVGVNQFCGATLDSASYAGSDLIVIQKSSVLGAGPIHATAFPNPGSLQAINVYAPVVAAYDPTFDPGSANGLRWGDFSFTSLDPCDDQSVWTIQEYTSAANQYGTRFAQLKAPPPATPALANPSTVAAGQSAASVVILGTSSAGSGFFDTPPSLSGEPCRQRITSSIPGVIVNSVTWNSPTQVTLSLDTTGATNGTKTVTIVNPDGQSASGAVLAIAGGPDLAITKTHVGNFFQGQIGATYTITVTNVGGAPTTAPVTVTDAVPTGLTATAISGAGWNCTLGTVSCTRSDALENLLSFPVITLTVNVASNAPALVTNTATVSGGGEI